MSSRYLLDTVFVGLPYTKAIADGPASFCQLAHARRTSPTTLSASYYRDQHSGRPPTPLPSSQLPPAVAATASTSGPSYLPCHHGEWNRLAATTISRECDVSCSDYFPAASSRNPRCRARSQSKNCALRHAPPPCRARRSAYNTRSRRLARESFR